MQDIRDGFARRLRDMHTETLDERSSDRDSRAMPRRDVYLRSRLIFGVATALGLFSGFQAYYYVTTFTEWHASLPFLLALNLGYWYSWAALTPAILYLARKAPFSSATHGRPPSRCTSRGSSSSRWSTSR